MAFNRLATLALLCLAAAVGPATKSVAQQATTSQTRVAPAEAEATEARLRAAIQMQPESPEPYARLGEFLMTVERPADARTALADAVRLAPENAGYRGNLATALLALDQFDQAEDHFQWAIELQPRTQRFYLGLGDALLGQQRFQDAESVLETARSIGPDSPDLAVMLAQAREGAGENDQSRGPERPESTAVQRALIWASAAILGIAGLGLALPLLASVFALVALLPRALLRGRRA